MIQITPAILTDDLEAFKSLILKFKDFESIDIDIIRSPFVENKTLQIEEIVGDLEHLSSKSVGLHFMVQDPEKDLIKLKNSNLKDHNLRIYLQQESNLKFLNSFDWPKNWSRAVSIKIESNLFDINYYKQFYEVQLMSVTLGWQGSEFQMEVFEKLVNLKKMGYNGQVSLDGSVNLKTAKIIKDYAVNRVSVGSYFTKADDVSLAKMKLELALNMKSDKK